MRPAGDDQIAGQSELKATSVSDAINGGDDHLGDLRMDQPAKPSGVTMGSSP